MKNTKETSKCAQCLEETIAKYGMLICTDCGYEVKEQTSKHTAGEWKIRLTSDNGGEVFSGVEETGLITDTVGNTIADTGIAQWLNLRASTARGVSNGDIDRVIAEKQANARLIASAPIMLEALRMALMELVNPSCREMTIELLKQTIATAEGE